MEPDTDDLLAIPDFLKVTPARHREAVEALRQAEAEEARRLAERRAAAKRAHIQAKAENERREARRRFAQAVTIARAERREAKNAAYERLLRLGGTFTIGQAQTKLKLDRKLILAAIRRGLKSGHVRKISRRRYRGV